MWELKLNQMLPEIETLSKGMLCIALWLKGWNPLSEVLCSKLLAQSLYFEYFFFVPFCACVFTH